MIAASLRLAGSRLLRGGGGLSRAVQNARTSWQTRDGLVLEVWDAAGHHGVGEASPLPGFSSESLRDCEDALERIHEMEVSWPLQAIPALATLPAARFALETAVADLVARRRGCSVAALFGGSVQKVPLSALISTGNDMLEAARTALARDVSTLKVKLGVRDFSSEIASLIALREALGYGFRLRLDANGSWSIEEARVRLSQLAEAQLDIEFVEQPVAPGQLTSLGICALPWAADESLQDPDEWLELRGAPGCVAWIIKPAAIGFLRARELAKVAAGHGHGVVITHLFDGPIGLAAACELALSGPPPLACGLDLHAGLAAWPPIDLPHFRTNHVSVITAHGRSGLGFAQAGVPWR